MKYNYQYFINRVLQIKHFIFVLEWIIKLRPKEVFDYGCARGPFVHAFNFFKIPCYGYDISKYSIKNPIGLAKGKISNSLPKKKFDTVICIDVMEHIPKEKEKKVIDDLIKLSNKWVLLSICDVSLKDKYYDSTHCNLETREYWIKKFEKRGLELQKIPFYWIYKNQLYLFKKKDKIKKINFVARNYFPDSPGGCEKVFYEIYKRAKNDFDCRIISSYSDKKYFPNNSDIFKKLESKNKIINYLYYLKNMSLKSNFGCDLVHANNIEILRLTKKPFILTIHHVGHFIDENIRHQSFFNRFLAKLLVFQANKASLVTTVSEKTRDDLRLMGVLNRIEIIPNGVDLKEFKPIKNKKNKKFIITHASRISPEKGQDFLIKCFERLPEKMKKECELRIIGYVSDKNYYDSLKKDGIKYFLNLSNKEYSKKIAESDLIIFPTFMAEGFGLVVLEALASGVPIIATNQPAIREAGGDICQYFEQGNSKELIKKIIKLYNNNKLREELTKKGIIWAKKFSWDNAYKKYKKLYLELLK